MKPTYRQRPAGLETAPGPLVPPTFLPESRHSHAELAALAEKVLAALAPIPSRPLAQRFAPHDLQALQEALDVAPFTLGELAALVRRYPRSLAAMRNTVTGQ